MDSQRIASNMHMGCWAPTSKAGYDSCLTTESVCKLCQQGQVTEAVEALGALVLTEYRVTKSLIYTVLKESVARKDLALSRRVHAMTVMTGYESDTFLCNHLLRMYASHARLQEAMNVFTVVEKPDAFTWSAVISAHVQHGQDKQAVQLYQRMRRSRVKADGHVFVAALQACARGADLESGQQVHADVLASGVKPSLFVCSCLVDMYAKCGSLDDARGVFDSLPSKDAVTWNAMVAGYSQHGRGQEALRLYDCMQTEGIVAASSVTFVCLLQACASVGISALEKGRQLHAQIRQRGFQADVFVANSLVTMYAKCGSLEDARAVFDGLGQKNVVTWNAMMAGYSQRGMGQEALRLYRAMQTESIVALDSVTFVCLLQACASLGSPALENGRQLHTQIRKRELQADVFVANSLVNMYSKCGSLEDAQRVFDELGEKNTVTWSALIAGYSQQGMGQQALRLYRAMQDEGLVTPNAVTFACLLQACANVGASAVESGRELHAQIRERELDADVFLASSLVNMYAKCGSLEDAERVFDGLGSKNVVTWSAMIAGYLQQGLPQKALGLYRVMQEEGVVAPNSVTFLCLLQACAGVGDLDVGRQLHAQIKQQGLQGDVLLGGSLVNMYGNCGSMVEAQQAFEAMSERDVVAWNALISGYSRQGESEVVFQLVTRMGDAGIQPDIITFLSILTVCSHTGLVNQGQEYFEAMSRQYGLSPKVEHYTCMVDILGRAGRLHDALIMARTMPVAPDVAVWHTLLGACRKWSNVEVGRVAFDEAVKLDKADAAAYLLMLNIYTGAQMWGQAAELEAMRKGNRARKQPGRSWWTDSHGVQHGFFSWGC